REGGELLRAFFRDRRRAARSGCATAVGTPLDDGAASTPAAVQAGHFSPSIQDSSVMSDSSTATASGGHAHHHAGHACDDPGCHAHGPHARPAGIYLISPSGAVRDPETVHLARQRLRDMGYRVTIDRTALAVHERFAGTDRQR